MTMREKILSQIQKLRKEKDSLEASLYELETALKVIDKIEGVLAQGQPKTKSPLNPNSRPLSSIGGAPSIPDMCLEFLKEAFPKGLLKQQILNKIHEKYGVTVNKNSLTTTLSSKLRVERGVVRFEGNLWYFIPQKNETADPHQGITAASVSQHLE